LAGVPAAVFAALDAIRRTSSSAKATGTYFKEHKGLAVGTAVVLFLTLLKYAAAITSVRLDSYAVSVIVLILLLAEITFRKNIAPIGAVLVLLASVLFQAPISDMTGAYGAAVLFLLLFEIITRTGARFGFADGVLLAIVLASLILLKQSLVPPVGTPIPTMRSGMQNISGPVQGSQATLFVILAVQMGLLLIGRHWNHPRGLINIVIAAGVSLSVLILWVLAADDQILRFSVPLIFSAVLYFLTEGFTVENPSGKGKGLGLYNAVTSALLLGILLGHASEDFMAAERDWLVALKFSLTRAI
jgi:hypothetical protein